MAQLLTNLKIRAKVNKEENEDNQEDSKNKLKDFLLRVVKNKIMDLLPYGVKKIGQNYLS